MTNHPLLRNVVAIACVTAPVCMIHTWTVANVRHLVVSGVICTAITVAHAVTLFLILDTINSMERNKESADDDPSPTS